MAVTLKQLAELSGLSIRTVSRVLKKQAHVQDDKRELVMRLAREYNYTPNMAARNLRLNRSKFVGILCSRITHEVFMQKLLDLEIRLESRGYYPIVGCYDTNPGTLEKLFAEWSGVVDFVVVTMFKPTPEDTSLEELFDRYPLTPIYVDQEREVKGHALEINRATGIRDAISTLIAEGKKCILRCGSLDSREKGLQEAFASTPENKRPKLIRMEGCGTFIDGLAQAPGILRTDADAVFFDTDRMALGFLHYAAAHKIPVPERIAVIGFDDEISGRLFYPSLSTVAHPVEELDRAIVSIVDEKPSEPVKMTFRTKFIRRMSS